MREWVRPTFAALLGAAVGGLFAVWGQSQTATQQAAREQQAAERKRAEDPRDQSRDDAARLFAAFAELSQSIRTSPPTISYYLNGLKWDDRWAEIWTQEKSLDVETGARLLTDAAIRQRVLKLVDYLNSARDFLGHTGFSTSLKETNLYSLVARLAAEGVDILGAYLRGENHQTERPDVWSDMARVEDEYAAWKAFEIAQAEKRDETAYDEYLASGGPPLIDRTRD